jgi:hypothetical protein
MARCVVRGWAEDHDPVPSEQSIVQPLVVAFLMIMLHEFGHGTTQRRLTHENHPIQALFFVRANKGLTAE